MNSPTRPDAAAVLSTREFQVVRLLALGRTGEQAAAELGISRSTVQNYTYSARQRTGAMCLVDLLRALGWLQVPDSQPGSTSE